MCNLYKISGSTEEIARMFGAVDRATGSNRGELVYPGYPGLVVAAGEVRTMNWGFPLALTGKNGQKLKPRPVNNTRSDKLDSFMWRYAFQERRCLIPVTAFAEAEGPKGSMTRTWLSLPDQPLFACAGIWTDSPEWGPVYSMVMTEACVPVSQVHDRMPVILRPEDYEHWLHASSEDAKVLCVPWAGEVTIERTGEPWRLR